MPAVGRLGCLLCQRQKRYTHCRHCQVAAGSNGVHAASGWLKDDPPIFPCRAVDVCFIHWFGTSFLPWKNGAGKRGYRVWHLNRTSIRYTVLWHSGYCIHLLVRSHGACQWLCVCVCVCVHRRVCMCRAIACASVSNIWNTKKVTEGVSMFSS